MSEPPVSPSELEGFDPGELLARGLETVRPTGDGHWVPLEAGEVARLLPQYEIESLLGRGGMGAVYKGRQRSLDRPVAIKLLPVEMSADSHFVARFHREARTLAKLHHSHIVAVYDSGQTEEGHLYFVMEYVDGTDLRRVLRGPGLNIEQALGLISEICEALNAAHRHGVMHRDIKPENVLISQAGEVKLADFGLARPMHENEDVLTGTNVVIGTPAYMAPEQHEGQADHRTDIFALGVMLYEMLTGRPPRGQVQPPSQRFEVDVRIDEVVMRALQSEPNRRYQSVVEMKSDVDRIRSNVPAPSMTPSESLPPRRASTKRTRRRLVLAGVALTCLAAAGWFAWQAWVNTPLRKLQAARPEKPYINSLGMSFVPVPGTNVYFCTTPTRLRDFRPFATQYAAEKLDQRGAIFTSTGIQTTTGSWDKTGFPQFDDYPAVNLSWHDAKAFCLWLSQREKLNYRLPTDHEWSVAAGLGAVENPTDSPRYKSDRVALYVWGSSSEIPERIGNLADATLTESYPAWLGNRKYRDGYALASPVTAFKPNAFGLYDMAGNVTQWCEDWENMDKEAKVERGASWRDYRTWASHRNFSPPQWGTLTRGFRCVIEATPFVETPR